jgi:hypothetical protein
MLTACEAIFAAQISAIRRNSAESLVICSWARLAARYRLHPSSVDTNKEIVSNI